LHIKKTLNGLTLSGINEKTKDGDFILKGKITGEIEVECIKCLKPFKKQIDEEINFKIVKPPYEGFDENYDIIEQEKLDIDEILKSEIESIKNDFSNICEKCENKEFDKEF